MFTIFFLICAVVSLFYSYESSKIFWGDIGDSRVVFPFIVFMVCIALAAVFYFGVERNIFLAWRN